MAENEDAIEEVADELPTEGDEGEEAKIKGIPKSLLIKIAIGFGVLLIIGGGVGAYFFFMADEPVVEEEMSSELTDTDVSSDDSIDMDNLIEAPKDASSEAEGDVDSAVEENLSDAQKILQMREDAVTLQEENLRLKMQLNEIEEMEPVKTEGESAETTVKEGESIANAKPEIKQYLDLYGEESQSYPSVRMPKREPIPDPKWGE